MKTKEELDVLKGEMRSLDKKLTKLSEDELKEVVGGSAYMGPNYSYSVFRHNNCGGEILNVGDPFASCVCSRCGETHYWHYSFDYTVEHTNE